MVEGNLSVMSFVGGSMQGEVVFLISVLDLTSSSFERLLRLVGETDFCLLCGLACGGRSRNGMILFARAIGYDAATNS